MTRSMRLLVIPVLVVTSITSGMEGRVSGAVTTEEVERAIRGGVRYLLKQQRDDGSWPEIDDDARTGTTSLVTLALLTAGESPDSPAIRKALDHLRRFDPGQLDSVYSVSLQTMVFAAARPKEDIVRIQANVDWLQEAQLKPGDRSNWPGSWSYKASKTRHGDNSNSQYALLGLNAATEVGVKVNPEVWKLARDYWQRYQQPDGSWAYTPDASNGSTASMTCAGISSLIISGLKRFRGEEKLVGDTEVEACGVGGADPYLAKAINWMATNFMVGQNFGAGQQWKYYYLYGLERTGRLSGVRFFGSHDWYREGAEELVHDQDKLDGYWRGTQYERSPIISTSFALLFLAKGRSPVVINKLRHGPGTDWNNDVDDVRNLVGAVSREWNHLLTWQVVDPNQASVDDLLQAPIAFINGHEAPVLDARGIQNLRDFVEQGGFIFAEACCGKVEFDRGFKSLMKQVFPDPEYDLHPLSPDHAVWRSKYNLADLASTNPLWGIEHGCRTVVIYSPNDLSCDWNQLENHPELPRVTKSTRIGQNVVDYATGRELPADKLAAPEFRDFKSEVPRRGALQIAKLRHAGDWNIAPLAIPNLTTTLRDKLKFDVVINHKELFPRDPNLVHYPLIYIHGRAAISFDEADKAALRKHLDPGGGTLFADAACGSPAFDAAFRRFVAELLPNNPMVPIPRDDDFYTAKVHYDLSDVQYSKAAGGGKAFPQLEGVKINGRWAVIYSKYDLGCALERHQGLDCKGYTYESAMRIAANIVVYATLP
ncbi:DUF4159 domain-containing protein [Tundrisphaera lichenicola]|uniref:DUF4159 domain-containing protein n=1 Tax=Tundrisphaera lichenicola TaxID=2029860 RepID=UPI003EBC80F1